MTSKKKGIALEDLRRGDVVHIGRPQGWDPYADIIATVVEWHWNPVYKVHEVGCRHGVIRPLADDAKPEFFVQLARLTGRAS